jgi:hypothetical protein
MRWEADERALEFPGQVIAMAKYLGLSLDEIGGLTPTGLEMGGKWYARWHVPRNGTMTIDRHELTILHSRDHLTMEGDGNYLWQAEARIQDEVITGTYSSASAGHDNRGSIYFWLHPDGQTMIGHWLGRSGPVMLGTGWGVMARDHSRADGLITTLIDGGYRNLTEWPSEEAP